MPHPDAYGTRSVEGLIQRAAEVSEVASSELRLMLGDPLSPDPDRKVLARALAELKDAVVCIETALARK